MREHPVRALNQYGLLTFDVGGRLPDPSAVDFSVCDDAHELFRINAEKAVTDAETLDYGPFTLVVGQWIAFTSTDYKSSRPVIRAGRLAKIVHFLNERRLLIAHPDDSLHEFDLREFPHVRPAHAITLGEAHQAPIQARLQIHLTKSRHSWSALYLAALRGRNVSIRIDPRIAKNVDELIAVVRRSLPAALPIELIVDSVPPAEMLTLQAMSDTPVVPSSDADVYEMFPEPDEHGHWQEPINNVVIEASLKPKHQSPHRATVPVEIESRERELLHEELRTVLASTKEGQVFLDRLEEALGPRALNRKEAFQQIRSLINVSAPTIELARLIYERGNASSPSTSETEKADLDEMLDFERPREWSKRDIDAFKLDIVTFKRSRMWDAVFDPNPNPKPY